MDQPLQQIRTLGLEDLPPEILGRVVGLCADNLSIGRTTLISLSVMNHYLWDMTSARLFERIRFRDSPVSPGDEILHSIRRFKATPGLSCHARTVSLHLNRLKYVGSEPFTLTKPYYYLILPELFETLAGMPDATELYLRLGGMRGERCLDGLEAATQWNLAGRKVNIRSLTVSPNSSESYAYDECSILFFSSFVRALPQLEIFYFEGSYFPATYMTLSPEHRSGATSAPNLTHVRLYKTFSDPRSRFYSGGWLKPSFSNLQLHKIRSKLEYLSVLGELGGFSASCILKQLQKLPRLTYVDITDEQKMEDQLVFVLRTLPRRRSDRLNYIKHLAHHHTLKGDRSKLARAAFDQYPKLRRICFVRSCVGEVYLRGYLDAVADSTGFISDEVHDADLGDISQAWHHGVPQTSLLPFPAFTPWEGIEDL